MWIATRVALVAVAVFTALLACPPDARAHVEPSLTDPASGLELTEPPRRVSLYFEEPVEGVYLRVSDERGERVDTDDARIEPGVEYEDPTQGVSYEALYTTNLEKLEPGPYTVEYCIRSVDRHVIGSSYEFRVLGRGAVSEAPDGADTHDHPDDRCDAPGKAATGPETADSDAEQPPTTRVVAFGGLGFAVVILALGTMLLLRRQPRGRVPPD